jgi:hypothetical protein
LKFTIVAMKSPWHRHTHGASQALRFNGLLATATAQGQRPGLTMQARWNHSPASPFARAGTRKPVTSWLPRIAGVLAFCALALGVFVAGSDTCNAHESVNAGNYSLSTLAALTDASAGAAPAARRAGGCRHKRKANRFAHAKTAL